VNNHQGQGGAIASKKLIVHQYEVISFNSLDHNNKRTLAQITSDL